MSDNTTGQILGASTATIILPATMGTVSGINFFYALSVFGAILVAINVVCLIVKKAMQQD